MGQLMIKNQVRAEKDSHLTETYLTTLMLYRKNMTPEQIAHKRLMSISTIWGHIFKLVRAGKVDRKELVKFVDQKKAEVIKAKIQQLGGSEIGSTPVKEALGDDYSWDEIRLVRMGMGD
jgi:ATP-dependent DNA helicase RecQ